MKAIRKHRVTGLVLILMLIVAITTVGMVSGCAKKGGDTANTWPQKAINIVVPASPGGAQDTMTRGFAPYLQKYLGVAVMVENMPGSGAVPAIHDVLSHPADGYTLMTITSPIVITSQIYAKDLNLEKPLLETFTPLVAMLTGDGNGIIAKKGVYKGVDELVAAAKTKRMVCAIATGFGNSDHATGVMFAQSYGIDFQIVPFGGAGEAMAAVLGGQCDFGIAGLAGSAIDFASLDMLAVSLDKRFEGYPDIPTFVELGHPDLTLNFCVGIAAPTGTPADVITTLQNACDQAFKDPEFQAWAKNAKKPIGTGMTGPQFTEFLNTFAKNAETIIPRLKADLEAAQAGK